MYCKNCGTENTDGVSFCKTCGTALNGSTEKAQESVKVNIPVSKIGVKISILGSLVFVCGYFGGYITMLLMLAYAFLIEKDEWLGAITIKTIILSVLFSVAFKFLSLPGDVLSVISNLVTVFGATISTFRLASIFEAAKTVLDWLEFFVFALLALDALRYKPIKVPFAEDICKKYM